MDPAKVRRRLPRPVVARRPQRYYGLEANPMPLGNARAALQAKRGGQKGDNF